MCSGEKLNTSSDDNPTIIIDVICNLSWNIRGFWIHHDFLAYPWKKYKVLFTFIFR